MKTPLLLILIFYSTFSFAQTKIQKPIDISLNNVNWMVRQVDGNQSYKAKIPGCIQTDLYKNGIIENPFLDTNEQKYKWIETKDWEYSCSFQANTSWFSYEKINLVFEGIDTYSEVYLNDSLILTTDNMFLKYEVDVKLSLKKEENHLRIIIKSPIKTALPQLLATKYRLPAGNDRNDYQTSVFTRKAPYQYGWDWGPRFVTMGIWKPVYIALKNSESIENISVTTDSITKDYAIISIIPNYIIPYENGYFLELKTENYQQQIMLNPSKDLMPIKIKINNPKIWYPNGYGAQPIYKLEVILKKKAEIIDQRAVKFGIRTIELVQEKDSIGQSFYFKVNGIPVFAKGANYIPQDNFLNEVDSTGYQKLIRLAKDGNMNMLRIWGGGFYENDYFYQLCDDAGILVWQDFMFACSMYPGNPDFLKSVQKEAEQNVIRLKNHPSIALWCGNNEMNELWYNWGYQKEYKYSAADSIEIWNNYLKIFHEILPNVLKENDPKSSYIPSSPLYGWGHKESMKYGDSHYWGVWWGREPFEVYSQKIPRFSSEYGFQSLPQYSTMQRMVSSGKLNFDDPNFQNHQKNAAGFETIKEAIQREFDFYSTDLEKLNYLSQVTQAQGIGLAIRAHRSARNYCMGTLYWQLNDCWPVTSWSSVDYFYNPKALWYKSKNDYKTFLLVAKFDSINHTITIVSDSVKSVSGMLEIQLKDFGGKVIFQDRRNVTINALGTTKLELEELNIKLSSLSKNELFLHSSLSIENKSTAENDFYFVKTKDLKLQEANLNFDVFKDSNSYTLKLKSDKFIKSLIIEADADGIWSENYLNLAPNETKSIQFIPYNFDSSKKVCFKMKYFAEKDVKILNSCNK